MRESSTYQAILTEGEVAGRAEEARNLILRLGTKRFGAPDINIQEHISAIAGIAQLELLADRLLEAENWAELLATE